MVRTFHTLDFKAVVDHKPVPFSTATSDVVSNDESGIDQLKVAGADVSQPAEIRHYLYFTSQDEAESAGRILRVSRYRVEVKPSSAGVGELHWLVVAVHPEVPTRQNITNVKV